MSPTRFRTDAQIDLPALARHGDACRCTLHARRRLGGALLGAGVLAESIGWPAFFIVSTVVALPALGMLWWLRATVQRLEVAAGAPTDD